jgi:hypothetical protein
VAPLVFLTPWLMKIRACAASRPAAAEIEPQRRWALGLRYDVTVAWTGNPGLPVTANGSQASGISL